MKVFPPPLACSSFLSLTLSANMPEIPGIRKSVSTASKGGEVALT